MTQQPITQADREAAQTYILQSYGYEMGPDEELSVEERNDYKSLCQILANHRAAHSASSEFVQAVENAAPEVHIKSDKTLASGANEQNALTVGENADDDNGDKDCGKRARQALKESEG